MYFLIDMKVEEPYYSRFGTANGVHPDYPKFCWLTKLYPYLFSIYGKYINVSMYIKDAETIDGMKKYFFKVDNVKVHKDQLPKASLDAEEILNEIKSLPRSDLCLLYHPTFDIYPSEWTKNALPLISYNKDVVFDEDDGGVYVKLDEYLYQYQYNIMQKQTEKQLKYAFNQGWISVNKEDKNFVDDNFLIHLQNNIYRAFWRLNNVLEKTSSILRRRANGDNKIIFSPPLNQKQIDYLISSSPLFSNYTIKDGYVKVKTENILPVIYLDKIITEARLKYL